MYSRKTLKYCENGFLGLENKTQPQFSVYTKKQTDFIPSWNNDTQINRYGRKNKLCKV